MGEVSVSDARPTSGVSTMALVPVLAYCLIVLAVYWPTAWSMVSIWLSMRTYAHGFLIVPIALWLVWENRAVLKGLAPKPVVWVQFFLIPIGLIWSLAELGHVQVIQQLALVGIFIIGIWSLIGHSLAKILAFPLGFLFLAVPMGEDLVPPMMEFTASSTVWLIKLSGIPVYREGLYFALPSGNWSVVQACSGVRYLIASFTLGVLFAYLNYRSPGRRLLFVAASIVVPVLANTGRAYMIVMLGHFSDMEIATGVDHLVYGWLFFGLVMLLLFWIGSFWREEEQAITAGEDPVEKEPLEQSGFSRTIVAFFCAILAACLWPFVTLAIERSAIAEPVSALAAPAGAAGWNPLPEETWDWRPRNRGANQEVIQFYTREDASVALYLQQYLGQREGTELAGGKVNSLITSSNAWRISTHRVIHAEVGGQTIAVRQVRLGSAHQELLLWYWYRIGDRYTSNRYVAKLYEVIDLLGTHSKGAALVLVATELGVGPDAQAEAQFVLQSFVSEQTTDIEASLDATLL